MSNNLLWTLNLCFLSLKTWNEQNCSSYSSGIWGATPSLILLPAALLSLRQVTAAEGSAFPAFSLFFPFTNTSLSTIYVLFYLQSTAPALYINMFHRKGHESLCININMNKYWKSKTIYLLCIGKGWKKEALAPEPLRCLKQPPAYQPVWLIELNTPLGRDPGSSVSNPINGGFNLPFGATLSPKLLLPVPFKLNNPLNPLVLPFLTGLFVHTVPFIPTLDAGYGSPQSSSCV